MKRAISMLLLLLSAVLAQRRTGEIRGLVVDIRHEPIHASQVVLRGTGFERTAQSDQAGLYQFLEVPRGEYELTITTPFFHETTIRRVRLQGNEVYVLPPLEMVFEGYDCTTRIPAYLSPLAQFEADKGALGGVIVNDLGHTVVGAKVTLFVPGAGVTRSTITDGQGRFSLRDIWSAPKYQIEVVRDGYFTQEFTDFKLQAGFEVTYDPLYLEACEKGRCQPWLRSLRVLPQCG